MCIRDRRYHAWFITKEYNGKSKDILSDVYKRQAGKTFQSVPKELQRNSFVWVIKQLKNSDWLHNTGLTDQFGLRVALPPIVCYYTATELLGTYKNVVLSAHVSQDPYTLKAYFDDLYKMCIRDRVVAVCHERHSEETFHSTLVSWSCRGCHRVIECIFLSDEMCIRDRMAHAKIVGLLFLFYMVSVFSLS